MATFELIFVLHLLQRYVIDGSTELGAAPVVHRPVLNTQSRFDFDICSVSLILMLYFPSAFSLACM